MSIETKPIADFPGYFVTSDGKVICTKGINLPPISAYRAIAVR